MKRWQTLFDQTLKRIPPDSPEWADANQSDPGIALLELFAWLGENLRYRMDSIPESQRAMLRLIARRSPKRRCRHARVLVCGESRKVRSGPARFIASKVGVKLHRIDLADVVSKYIGETEKNLDRVLGAAQKKDGVLFFDEADALFGKRTQPEDSHDRYANSGINYLLGRLAKSNGIAIIAIKRRENFDAASLRRFKWIVSLDRASPGANAEQRKKQTRRSREG